jgi:UDP-GlcNAc:undecaprenyl-phosphate GlcNAc-1-phosphate transferase
MITATQTLVLFFSSFFIVGTFTPLMRKIALKLNFVDRPNSSHKSHSEAIPYLGGIAIILGIIPVIFTALLSQENLSGNLWIALSFFTPALLLGIVGLIDDRKALNPLPRLIAQSSAGAFIAIFVIATNTIGNPSGNLILDAIITIIWLVGISNSINFFDNLDGGAAGAVAATAIGLAFITQSNGQTFLAACSITIFAAMLGFLIWNKSPAKIYMGDAGSLFLGTIIAVLTIRLNPNVDSKIVSFAIPILLLAVPILDTSVAIISRLQRGVPIYQGGRDHLSHRLIRRGFSKREAAFTLWSLSLIFVAMAAKLATNSTTPIYFVYLAIAFWIFLLVLFLKSSNS